MTTLQRIYQKIFDNKTKKITAKSVRESFAILDEKIDLVSSGTIGVLKIDDSIPIEIGKYELADIGEYTNLVPIIHIGEEEPTSAPITTVDGFYNAIFWDGVNSTQIKVEMPNTKEYSKSLLRTSFYSSVLDFNSAIDFMVGDSGKISELKIKNIRLSYNGNFAETNADYTFDSTDIISDYGYVVATFTDYTAGGITLQYVDGFEWNAVLTDNQFILCFLNNGILYSKYSEIQSLISKRYNPNISSDVRSVEYRSLLKNFKTGVIDWQNGFQGNDSFDGECLNITNYVVLPMQPKNTNVRILVKGGSNAQIRLGAADFSAFYFVYQTGNSVSIGKTGSGVLGSASGVVDASKDYYLEVFFGDTSIKAKVWNVAQKSLWDVNVSITEDLGRSLTLNEYSGNTKIKDVLYYDNTVALYNKIDFKGYFFEEIKGAEKLIRTFNQGVSFEFETNSKKAVLDTVVDTAHVPTIAVSVDGSKPIIINLANGNTTLFDNLSDGNHSVNVWLDGLYEADPFWNNNGKGIFLRNIIVDAGSYIRKPIDSRKKVRIDGDSITEGVNVRTTGALPNSNSGYNVYASNLARLLDLKPLIHGFGATGIVVDGSGGVPKFKTSISNYRNGKRVFNEDIPDYILINGGTNDAGASIPSGNFVAEYQDYVDYNANRYPLAKIVLLVPFNGAFKTQIIGLGVSNSLDVIDMSFFTGITTTDGTHPDLIGTIKLAEQLAVEMKKLL